MVRTTRAGNFRNYLKGTQACKRFLGEANVRNLSCFDRPCEDATWHTEIYLFLIQSCE